MGGGLKRWADMVMGDSGSQRGGYRLKVKGEGAWER